MVHIHIIPGVWDFSAFRGICRAFGEGHGRKRGLQGAGCIGIILLLSPAIIDLWATCRDRGLARPATSNLGISEGRPSTQKLNVCFRYTQKGREFGCRQPRTTPAPLCDLIHLTLLSSIACANGQVSQHAGGPLDGSRARLVEIQHGLGAEISEVCASRYHPVTRGEVVPTGAN